MIRAKKLTQVPATVWILGTMSLLLNVSSIMIFSLSPLYLTQVFGLTTLSLGMLEGAIATGSLLLIPVLLRGSSPQLAMVCCESESQSKDG